MERLTSHIEYLLDRHDCIIVPGVGAFIKRMEPAHVNAGCIIPPARMLSFNPELTHDDSMLASSYARRLDVPYTSALRCMTDDIAMLRATLANDGAATIGSLGVLVYGEGGVTTFQPANSIFTTMGLKAVTLPDLSKASGTTPAVIELPAPRRYTAIVHSVMKYAAMLTILLATGIVLTTPTTVGDPVTRATLNPVEFVDETVSETAAPDLLLSMPPVQENLSVSEYVPEEDAPRYCLVIASLATRELALEYMTSPAGTDAAGIIESDGRYRVYSTTGMTIESVMDTAVIDRHPGAWPCAIR